MINLPKKRTIRPLLTIRNERDYERAIEPDFIHDELRQSWRGSAPSDLE